jgi:hypothetical protein
MLALSLFIAVRRALTKATTAALWLLLCSIAISPVFAADRSISASDKLQAVKQALVDLALETDVKLGSTAYLDVAGVLHESSVLLSDSLVRGVRVVSYLEEAGVTVAKVDASILSDPTCPGSRPEIRREASVRVVSASPNNRVGDHYMNELALVSEQALLHSLAASTDWSVKQEKLYTSSYQRYVSGTAADQVPYRFDIVMRDRDPLQGVTNHGEKALHYGLRSGYDTAAWAVEKIPELDFYKPWPTVALEYELILVDRARGRPLWRKTLPITYPKVDRGYSKDAVPVKFSHQVTQITERFIADVTATMDCQTEYYHLAKVPGANDIASINAGQVAGIKVGDQFLISGDAKILNQVLSMSGLAGLGLAQVESVGAHSSTIKHIAGPKWTNSIDQTVALHF